MKIDPMYARSIEIHLHGPGPSDVPEEVVESVLTTTFDAGEDERRVATELNRTQAPDHVVPCLLDHGSHHTSPAYQRFPSQERSCSSTSLRAFGRWWIRARPLAL